MKPFAATYAMNPERGNGDAYASWSLDEITWLGVVADAPMEARAGSADLVARLVESYIDERGRDLIAAAVRAGGGPVILGDLLARCHQRMLADSATTWAAAVFVLIGPQTVSVAGVGDCAAYLAFYDGPLLRYSETTRVDGCRFLPEVHSAMETRPQHMRQGVYLGAGALDFSETPGITLPAKGIARILLVSDGMEEMVGSVALSEALGDSVKFEKAQFSSALRDRVFVDDVTFLGIALTPPIVDAFSQPTEDGKVAAADAAGLSMGAEVAAGAEIRSSKTPGPRSWAQALVSWFVTLVGLGLLSWFAWRITLLYLKETSPNAVDTPVIEGKLSETPEN
jgi:hypothetical protein